MDFNKKRTKVSELRSLLGKVCLHRTLRGWMPAGTIVALELRDEEIYLVVKDGVRRNHEKHLPLKKCKIKDQPTKDTVQSKLDAAEEKQEEKSNKEKIAEKLKKLDEAKKRQRFVTGSAEPLRE